MTITDAHTHHPCRGAVVNFDPSEPEGVPAMDPEMVYSVGIHPWRADRATPQMLERVRSLAALPGVVAVGEAGLDKVRGPELDVQARVFVEQARIAEDVRKPLIIHAVRSFPELIRLKRELRPTVPWVVHGFRGNATLAGELLRHGFRLSYGPRHNAEALAATPVERRLVESDEDNSPLDAPHDHSIFVRPAAK